MDFLKKLRRNSDVPLTPSPKAPRMKRIELPSVDELNEKAFISKLEDTHDREDECDHHKGFRARQGSTSTSASTSRSESPYARCASSSSSSSASSSGSGTSNIVAPTPRWKVAPILREEGWRRVSEPVEEEPKEQRRRMSSAPAPMASEPVSHSTRAPTSAPRSNSPVAPLDPRRSERRSSQSAHRERQRSSAPDAKRREHVSASPPPFEPSRPTTAERGSVPQASPERKPLKGILKSTPRSIPRTTPINLHWQLLPYNPQQCKKRLLFDVAHSVENMRDITNSFAPLALGTAVMDKPAADIPLTEMRIQCRQLPHWDIIVENRAGITCGDVYRAIHHCLSTRLTEDERRLYVSQRNRESVQAAFEQRCQRDPGYDEYVRMRGLTRVDLLGGKTIFSGLICPPDSGDYWILELGQLKRQT